MTRPRRAAMTDAQRVAQIPWSTRMHIRTRNVKGEARVRIAKSMGIPLRTIAAVLYAMDLWAEAQDQESPLERWVKPIEPGWKVHGEVRREAAYRNSRCHNP